MRSGVKSREVSRSVGAVRLAERSTLFAFAAMPRRLATRLLLLAVAFADEADDTRAAAAADHLRADELKELLMMAGVEFG